MKKFILGIFIIFFNVFSVFAQISVQSDDVFYTLVQNWRIRNVVSSIPPIKPYPVANIKQILMEVMEKGSVNDIALAEYYYESITGKKIHVQLDAEDVFKVEETTEDGLGYSDFFSIYPSVAGDIAIYNDNVTFGYKAGLAIQSEQTKRNFLPLYSTTLNDISVFPINIEDSKVFIDADTALSGGTVNAYGQIGLFRPSQGLGYCEDRSVNVSFTYIADKYAYAQNYSITDDLKYKSYHVFRYDFTPRISLAYYEYIVFADKLNPSYVLPVPYIAIEKISGYGDNFGAGLDFNANISNEIVFNADFYLDSIKYKSFAAKAGLTYAPADSVCKKLFVGYEVITPYTYSGLSKAGTNVSLDSVLYEPNSDVINFSLSFVPVTRLAISVDSYFLRHGNICDNYSDSEAIKALTASDRISDGGKLTAADYSPTSYSKLNLFKQSHFMYVIKNEVFAEYGLPVIKDNVLISLKFGYTFQYVHNYGVSSDLYPAGSIIENPDGSYTDSLSGHVYTDYEDLTDPANASVIVSGYKSAWKNSFVDKVDNYFTVGICIKW